MHKLVRVAFLPLVAALCFFTLGATDSVSRYNELGHKLMCSCGCGAVLPECGHEGCQGSTQMRAELRAAIERGDSDNKILTAFQDKYGPTVLAAPLLSRFNVVAWIVPPVLLLLGIGGTVMLVRQWRLRTVVGGPGGLTFRSEASLLPAKPEDTASKIRERIRNETEEL